MDAGGLPTTPSRCTGPLEASTPVVAAPEGYSTSQDMSRGKCCEYRG